MLHEYLDQKCPIYLQDCEIKQARRGNKMDIILKGSAKITASPKKIEVPDADYTQMTPKFIALNELSTIDA